MNGAQLTKRIEGLIEEVGTLIATGCNIKRFAAAGKSLGKARFHLLIARQAVPKSGPLSEPKIKVSGNPDRVLIEGKIIGLRYDSKGRTMVMVLPKHDDPNNLIFECCGFSELELGDKVVVKVTLDCIDDEPGDLIGLRPEWIKINGAEVLKPWRAHATCRD